MSFKLICTTVLLTLALSISAWAGGAEAIFVEKCGSCHAKGGETAPVNPADKAGLVWKKYFKRGRHPGNLSAHVNDAEMAEIMSYLQDHAADSDHPVAAAIPK